MKQVEAVCKVRAGGDVDIHMGVAGQLCGQRSEQRMGGAARRAELRGELQQGGAGARDGIRREFGDVDAFGPALESSDLGPIVIERDEETGAQGSVMPSMTDPDRPG